MAGNDPYGLLGVPPDASSSDIRWAYERELNRANRAGALRHAEDLLSAFETLRDPRRRALYDRHGLTPLPQRRLGPPSAPTPWRAAAAAPSVLPASGRHVGQRRHGSVLALLLVVLGILVGVYLASHWPRTSPARPGTAPSERVQPRTTPSMR